MYETVRYSTGTSGAVPYDVAGQNGNQSGITCNWRGLLAHRFES